MEKVQPGPGQESVWDYPRPPLLDLSSEHIVVAFGGEVIAETARSWRILETSHPPTYYLPRSAFTDGSLRAASGSSYCEWKGIASYLDVIGGDRIAASQAWWYPNPTDQYAELRDHVGLYPGAMDLCTVNGERVEPQPGNFYGGWVTSRVVGPFKGSPGTTFW